MDFPSVSFGLQMYDDDTNDDTAEKLTTIALKVRSCVGMSNLTRSSPSAYFGMRALFVRA